MAKGLYRSCPVILLRVDVSSIIKTRVMQNNRAKSMIEPVFIIYSLVINAYLPVDIIANYPKSSTLFHQFHQFIIKVATNLIYELQTHINFIFTCSQFYVKVSDYRAVGLRYAPIIGIGLLS